jgi:hypothetical protein
MFIGFKSNPLTGHMQAQGLTQVPHRPCVVAELWVCQMLYVTDNVQHRAAR